MTFRGQPVRPIDQLRRESLEAVPPADPGPFFEPVLEPLARGIRLDLRYATATTAFGAPLYQSPRALPQPPAAEALGRANLALGGDGFGLLVFEPTAPGASPG